VRLQIPWTCVRMLFLTINNSPEIKELHELPTRYACFVALSLIVGAPFNSAFAGQVRFTKIDVPGATFGTQPAGINRVLGRCSRVMRDLSHILCRFRKNETQEAICCVHHA
jgi:hypothetical protein